MPVIVHLVLVTLASMFGWDLTRRILPFRVPGPAARLAVVGLGVLLWVACPLPLLGGMACAGLVMLLNSWVNVEPVYDWFGKLKDGIASANAEKEEKTRTTKPRGIRMDTAVLDDLDPSILGKRAQPKTSVGNRIPDL